MSIASFIRYSVLILSILSVLENSPSLYSIKRRFLSNINGYSNSKSSVTYRVVVMRHGESTFVKERRWAGWHDVDLTESGIEEARAAGRLLKQHGFTFDIVFTSVLKRAIKTVFYTLDELDLHWIDVKKHWRLNDRFSGALQGQSKPEMARKHGEDQVKIWRRSFHIRPPPIDKTDKQWPGFDLKYRTIDPNLLPLGECLKDTQERVLQYWHEKVVPAIKSEQNVLIVAHGNTMRALIKYLDNISNEGIAEYNIPTAFPIVYELDKNMNSIKHYYLVSDAEAKAAVNKVIARGKAM